MTNEEFIKQQLDAGYNIHCHCGVWWQSVLPFFCRPVVPFQQITPGKIRPNIIKSFLGYKHLVYEDRSANSKWSVLALLQDKLKAFSMKSLSSAKRAQVRKGLKNHEIKRIESIDEVISDMKEACISTAERTGAGRPSAYYAEKYSEWRRFMTREFALPGREWWGAFMQGRLVAYYYAYQIDDTMIISAAKSRSDSLSMCPNDALLFTFLEYGRDLPTCGRVIFGDWSEDAPSLNEFKEKYGFERVDLPIFVRYNPVVRLARKIKARRS